MRARVAELAAVIWRIEHYASEVRHEMTPTDDIEELDAYVQGLRDITDQTGFPSMVEWPVTP